MYMHVHFIKVGQINIGFRLNGFFYQYIKDFTVAVAICLFVYWLVD